MTSIGETLRRERLRRSLDLDHICNELRISPRFLQAIESDRFDELPGGMFAKSFVRQYARYLGLDEEELANEVQKVLEPTPAPVPASPEAPRSAADIHVPRVAEWEGNPGFSWSSSLPALAGVVVVMLVCSMVYSWWQRTRVAAVSAQNTAEAQAPQAEPVEPAPPAAAPVTPEPPPVEAPKALPAAAPVQAEARPVAVRSEAVTPEEEDAPEPSASRSASAVRVELTASEPVWVLAQTDGKYSFSGTLDANETRSVEASQKVVVRLGNAGGVSITLNGKPIGAVGPKGQVRTIQLTSGGWTVAAPKASLPVDDF
jgi:cytoskeleton protein RodZ